MIHKGIFWEQEHFYQQQVSSLSVHESGKPDLKHRVNVTVMEIKPVGHI